MINKLPVNFEYSDIEAVLLNTKLNGEIKNLINGLGDSINYNYIKKVQNENLYEAIVYHYSFQSEDNSIGYETWTTDIAYS